MTDFSMNLIFKYKQHKNVNIANFVYYGKTRMRSHSTFATAYCENKEGHGKYMGIKFGNTVMPLLAL